MDTALPAKHESDVKQKIYIANSRKHRLDYCALVRLTERIRELRQ